MLFRRKITAKHQSNELTADCTIIRKKQMFNLRSQTLNLNAE